MFKLEEFWGKRILKSSLIDDGVNVGINAHVFAFFTTRDLPLKSGERDDLTEEIENNKKFLCEKLNIPLENLFIPQQTHSDNVRCIEEGKKARGQDGKLFDESNLNFSTFRPFDLSTFENTDALITNQPNIAIALNFADCVPVMFYDPVRKVAAIAHAGWKGTAARIAAKTAEKMINEFHSNPEDIIALIGPSIGKCCFEVKDDVKEKILASIDESAHSQVCTNNNIDLKLVNKVQLLAIGIKKIDLSEDCTSCKTELFFSYRKENGHTARHSAVIMVKRET